MLKVISVLPGEEPAVKFIEEGLSSLQHEVDGYIECVYPFDDPVGLIVNEEGKINGMELNRALRDGEGNIYDIIAGPFLIIGLTDCDFCSVEDEYIEKYTEMFRTPEMFFNLNGKIHVVPLFTEADGSTDDIA